MLFHNSCNCIGIFFTDVNIVSSLLDVNLPPLAGVVGDLVSGEVDLGVAAIIQTSEKAEVVDFAAPYFDLSGISIALRKKVPIQSFFKFALVFTPGMTCFPSSVQLVSYINKYKAEI